MTAGHPHRRALTLAFLAAGVLALLAGCGSSGLQTGNSTITVGAEGKNVPRNDVAVAPATTSTSSSAPTATTPAATATTPKTGPLSTEPKVTPPKGAPPTKLVIKDLITGTGPAATAGSTVTVNYVGVLYKDGKIFDSSWQRKQPATFALNAVIKGWGEGIPGMKVGGRRELIIPPDLAYGKAGQGTTIPPNSTLVFVVDLLGVQGG